MTKDRNRHSSFVIRHLLIFLYAAVLLLPLLDNGTVLTRHEVLAAEPAREMLDSGAPLAVQSFAGEYRTAKPPTMSWLIALFMAIFDSRSEFVARLPAAIAGIVTAHAAGAIASRLLSPRAGLLAGLITVTTFWFQMQARLAEADMPLVAAVTLAMLALLPQAGPSRAGSSLLPSVAFYSLTGLGFLLKGVAPLVTIPSAIIYCLWTKDERTRRILRHPVGIAIFLILLIAWPVIAYLTHPPILDDWYVQTLGRATGDIEADRDPITAITYIAQFPFYFWMIPFILLPATPAAAIGLYSAFDRWRTARPAQFLLAWTLPFLILLTLMAWKHKHYALPIMPAFSILAAYGTIVWMRSLKRPRLATPLLVTWFIGCAVAILLAQAYVLPRFDVYREHSASLAFRANELLPADQRVALIGLGEAHVAYYLNNVPYRIDDPSKVTGDHVAIATLETVEQLRATHHVEVLHEAPPRFAKLPGQRLVLFRVTP